MDDFDDADDGLKAVCHSNWTIFSRHPNLDGWVIDKDGWFLGSNHLVVVETWREEFSMIVFNPQPDSTYPKTEPQNSGHNCLILLESLLKTLLNRAEVTEHLYQLVNGSTVNSAPRESLAASFPPKAEEALRSAKSAARLGQVAQKACETAWKSLEQHWMQLFEVETLRHEVSGLTRKTLEKGWLMLVMKCYE
jgi:hypothetical protein